MKKSQDENKTQNKRKTDFLFELMFTYNNILCDTSSTSFSLSFIFALVFA